MGKTCLLCKNKAPPFFQIPSDLSVRFQWLAFLSTHGITNVNDYSVLCKNHFEIQCFDFSNKVLRLRNGCIPSLNIDNTTSKTPSKTASTNSSSGYKDLEQKCQLLSLKLKQVIRKYNNCLSKRQDVTEKLEKHSDILKIIENICEDVESGDEKAVFLFNVIQNYKKKVPLWNYLTLQLCTLWKFCSPKGYQFCCKNIIKLPSKTTMTRFLDKFNGQTQLVKVRMSRPKDLNHVCDVCNKAFAEVRILKRHLKIHLERKKPHECDQCEMSFAESSNLSQHKKKHTDELRNIQGKPQLCSVCGRTFKWASSLSKHMKYHTGNKLLTCKYCNKQYVEARSLKMHIRSHTGERTYRCTTCDKSFTRRQNLEKHIRVHTGEKPFTCTTCGKGFTQSGYMRIHMRTHTGERPYLCTTCGKAFAGSNNLAAHQRIHTGEKPHACNLCGKCFSRQDTLVIHTRSHTGDKPHICHICKKGFTSSRNLSGHMRTHTGEKPHSCTICGKRFAGSSNLKVHIRGHSGQKFSVCKFCNKLFSQPSLLQNHINTYHSITKAKLVKLDAIQVQGLITEDGQIHSVPVQLTGL